MIVNNLFNVIPYPNMIALYNLEDNVRLWDGLMIDVPVCYLEYTVDKIQPYILDGAFIVIRADIHSELNSKVKEVKIWRFKIYTL